MEKKLLYFGCIGGKGHYLWESNSSKMHNHSIKGINSKCLGFIDGTFTPSSTKQGDAMVSNVGPIKILAWHDYTVDSRLGSNSVLVGIGYNDVVEMLNDANKKFPAVIKRQTATINVLES